MLCFVSATSAYHSCSAFQKQQLNSNTNQGQFSLKAKNCSVQVMKYSDFIRQENIEELAEYEGCVDVTTITCICNNMECANHFFNDPLKELTDENTDDESNHLSYVVTFFVFLVAFILAVFVFILISLLIKYCLLSDPDELHL